jgi:hypothetical protein
VSRATNQQVKQWQEDGWVLIEELVPRAEIDAALDDLWLLFPRPEEFHAGAGDERREAFVGGSDQRNLFRSTPAELLDTEVAPNAGTPQFRPEQFLGRKQFPFPGSGALNHLAVHDNLVDFAKRALQSTDLRLYQMAIWAKYTGVANYEQPMHQDHNHSIVPPRAEPGWWHLEGFLYLSDVDHDVAPTRVVGLGHSRGRLSLVPLAPAEAPELYGVELPAAGPRGSYLAYRSDVFHRGVDLTRPGGSRFLYGLSYKLGGQDWIGYENAQPSSTVGRFIHFAEDCTPEQLALFGVPLPGHPFWNGATLAAMADRYPGLDLDPWREGLGQPN